MKVITVKEWKLFFTLLLVYKFFGHVWYVWFVDEDEWGWNMERREGPNSKGHVSYTGEL